MYFYSFQEDHFEEHVKGGCSIEERIQEIINKLVCFWRINESKINGVAENNQEHQIVKVIVADCDPNTCATDGICDCETRQRLLVTDMRRKFIRVVINLYVEKT